MRTTVKDADVIFVDGDGKFIPGVIHEVIAPGAARIDITPTNKKKETHVMVQGVYSEKGESGSFHYPDETEAVKKQREVASAASTPAKTTAVSSKPAASEK